VTAEVTHDRKALQRILDEDFVVTNSSGKTSDRATFISGILSESIAPYDVAHDIVGVHGDTAVVVDRFGEGLATRATWVAVKRNGQWRVIFEQFSKLAEP
jgi:hypothetical protein